MHSDSRECSILLLKATVSCHTVTQTVPHHTHAHQSQTLIELPIMALHMQQCSMVSQREVRKHVDVLRDVFPHEVVAAGAAHSHQDPQPTAACCHAWEDDPMEI